MKKHTIKSDCKTILKMLRARNPEFNDVIDPHHHRNKKSGTMSLEEFLEIGVSMYKSFNRIK